MTVEGVRINAYLLIPAAELSFSASRSSGPGGQNVNKVATRITLAFSVSDSPTLSEVQRERLLKRLSTRISGDGLLQLSCQNHRSQEANRRAVVKRFGELVAWALRDPKPRRATRVPAASRKRRREEKVRRSRVKALRRKPADED